MSHGKTHESKSVAHVVTVKIMSITDTYTYTGRTYTVTTDLDRKAIHNTENATKIKYVCQYRY